MDAYLPHAPAMGSYSWQRQRVEGTRLPDATVQRDPLMADSPDLLRSGTVTRCKVSGSIRCWGYDGKPLLHWSHANADGRSRLP